MLRRQSLDGIYLGADLKFKLKGRRAVLLQLFEVGVRALVFSVEHVLRERAKSLQKQQEQ